MENKSDAIHVLVVDDEQDIRDGSERILNRMGFEVSTAERGEKALEIVKQRPVDIVFLDLKMPGMDGMEVLGLIHESHAAILVIVITGYATVETAIEAMKRGAYDFIPKPFEPDQLRIVVNRAREKILLTRDTETLARERQRTLIDLDTEKSRIHTILESFPNGVMVTSADGQVVLMNPAFKWMTGIAADRDLGEPLEAYIQDEGFCKLVKNISRGRHNGDSPVATYEFTPGEEKYLMATARPVLNEEKENIGAVVSLVDITAMKMLDRLKSEFVAKVSHELRSPLSTIHEQLAMVIRDMTTEESGEDQYILSRAKEKTQGLISLIGDLLDLSRIEAGAICQQPRTLDLEDLLKHIVDFLQARAKAKNQTLSYHASSDKLPQITADPMALESIFGNLISNAINYTPADGRITVTTALTSRGIQVEVRDTGFGIEAKHLENIFKRFYRVKDNNTRYITGTGLGLPIVKGLLDELGGTVEVESTPGEGTAFTVFLPVGDSSGHSL